jgi:hypothetical protein
MKTNPERDILNDKVNEYAAMSRLRSDQLTDLITTMIVRAEMDYNNPESDAHQALAFQRCQMLRFFKNQVAKTTEPSVQLVKAKNAGYESARLGCPMSDNPYSPYCTEYDMWHAGFIAYHALDSM